jgi:hypothetical protein
MEAEFLPIRYGGYWDVPSSFITVYRDDLYYFKRDDFDEDLDDYPRNYKVYRIPDIKFEDAFAPRGDHPRAVLIRDLVKAPGSIFIGEVPTRNVIFDDTNRQFVNAIVFKQIVGS